MKLALTEPSQAISPLRLVAPQQTEVIDPIGFYHAARVWRVDTGGPNVAVGPVQVVHIRQMQRKHDAGGPKPHK